MKHYSLPARVASFIFLGCSLLMCTKKDQLATLENEPGGIEKKFFTTNRTQHDHEKVFGCANPDSSVGEYFNSRSLH